MNAQQNGLMALTDLAQSFQDAGFRAQLKQNPQQTLATKGVEVPENTQVKVVENNKNTLNIVIPVISTQHQLSDDDLDDLAAGEAIFTGGITLGAAIVGTLISGLILTTTVGAIGAGIVLPVLGAEDII